MLKHISIIAFSMLALNVLYAAEDPATTFTQPEITPVKQAVQPVAGIIQSIVGTDLPNICQELINTINEQHAIAKQNDKEHLRLIGTSWDLNKQTVEAYSKLGASLLASASDNQRQKTIAERIKKLNSLTQSEFTRTSESEEARLLLQPLLFARKDSLFSELTPEQLELHKEAEARYEKVEAYKKAASICCSNESAAWYNRNRALLPLSEALETAIQPNAMKAPLTQDDVDLAIVARETNELCKKNRYRCDDNPCPRAISGYITLYRSLKSEPELANMITSVQTVLKEQEQPATIASPTEYVEKPSQLRQLWDFMHREPEVTEETSLLKNTEPEQLCYHEKQQQTRLEAQKPQHEKMLIAK